jgi:hypothetical protein
MNQTSPAASRSFQEEATGAIQPRGSDGEQRDNTRYQCEGDVEFVCENTEVRTFAKLTDISFGGCYVEMTATSSPGTEVCLAIEVSGIRFRVRGIVKTSDPCLGMGILFTEISIRIKNTFSSCFSFYQAMFRSNALLQPYPQISKQEKLSRRSHNCSQCRASSHVTSSCTSSRGSPSSYASFVSGVLLNNVRGS